MSVVSNSQWAKLLGRAALKEDAPGFISGEFIQALLEGRLIMPPGLIPAYAVLCTLFDWVWDGYKWITAIERIPACVEVPAEGNPNVETFELIHLARDISTQNVLIEIDKRGMRPATFEELLAYAKKFPKRQLDYPIVALGSVLGLDGGRGAPCLGGFGSQRSLDARVLDGGWFGFCRFLAVRK